MLNEICAEYGYFPSKKERYVFFLSDFSVKMHKKRLYFPYCMHKQKMQTFLFLFEKTIFFSEADTIFSEQKHYFVLRTSFSI